MATRIYIQKYFMLFAVILVFIILTFLKQDMFFSVYNLTSIFRELSFIGIISCGVCMLMIMGQFDLSVGAILTFSTVLTATFITKYNLALAITIPLLFGLAIGFINGFLVGNLKANSFLITLGTTYLLQGAVMLFTNGTAITNLPRDFVKIGRGEILWIPIPVIIFIIVAIICWLVLTQTSLGLKHFAIGGSEKAAISAGINVTNVKIFGFMATGFLSSLAGILYTSRMAVASPLFGYNMELDAIAAVVLGGTYLFGGSGSISGTVLGVLLFAVVINGLNLLQVQPAAVYIVKGTIVAIAVALNVWVQSGKSRN